MDKATRRLDDCEVAGVWVRGGSLDKIPWIISLFDRGKEVRLEFIWVERSRLMASYRRWIWSARMVNADFNFKISKGE